MALSDETKNKIARFAAIRNLLTEEERKALTELGEFLNSRFGSSVPDEGLTTVVNIIDPEGIAETDPGFTSGDNDNEAE